MEKVNVYIEDDFREIVKRTSDAVLSQVQQAQPNTVAVQYYFGTLMEFQESLLQKGQTAGGKNLKWPCVYLFLDVTEPRGLDTNETANLRIRIAILNQTSRTFKAEERFERNFKPIIMPIYYELMKQISLSGYFLGAGYQSSIRHNTTRRYYWGTESAAGNTANKLSDPIDGLDIENLELKHYLKRCIPTDSGIEEIIL